MAITTKNQKIFTNVLSASTLTIMESDGLTAVSLQLTAGAGSYSGTRTVSGVASTPIPLALNTPVTITSEQTKFIDDLLIDGSAGTIEIIGR